MATGRRPSALLAALLVSSAHLGCGLSSDTSTPHHGLFVFADAGADVIAHDEQNLYWVGSSGVVSAPLAGGTPTPLSDRIGNCYGITVDATHVYWTNFDDGTVNATSIDGGHPAVLAKGQDGANAIIVGGQKLYWIAASSSTESIVTMPTAGGSAAPLATGGTYQGLAVDATHLYFGDESVGGIQRAQLAGGAPKKFVDTVHAISIVSDGTTLYWTSFDEGTVNKADASGAVTVLASNLEGPFSLALGGDDLYFTVQGPQGTNDRASIVKLSIHGGTPETLVEGRPASGLGSVTVGPTYVYWIEMADKVMGFPR